MLFSPGLPLPLCPFLPPALPSPPPPIPAAPRIRRSFADRFAGTRHFSRWRESECGDGFGRAGRPEGGRILLEALEGSGPEQIAPRAGLGIPVGVGDAHLALAEEASPLRWSPGRVGVRTSSPASLTSGHLKGAPAPPAPSASAPLGRAPWMGFNACGRRGALRGVRTGFSGRPRLLALLPACGAPCPGGELAGRSRRDATPTSEALRGPAHGQEAG